MIEIGDGMMDVDNEEDDDEDPVIIREREALWYREESYGTSIYAPRPYYARTARSFDTETL
jgi:hypothetical protein